MSQYIATRAIRGANALVSEAELMLHKAIGEKGRIKPRCPSPTRPTISHYPGDDREDGRKDRTDLTPVLEQARDLLHPVPSDSHWTPYLGETLDAGWQLCWLPN